MDTAKIVVAEDDEELRLAICETLEIAGYEVVGCDCAEAALAKIQRCKPQLLISDISMPGISGLQLLDLLQQQNRHIPVILITAFASVASAVKAMQQGAVDYIQKPFAPEVLVNIVARYVSHSEASDDEPVAEDSASKEIFALADRVAASDATVLLTGPSGSGKEVLSRYIHNHSPRKNNEFVAINCAAIPENMLEATLFGYEKGAYTGAHQSSPGKFEQAQGGTILLDEVSEMPASLQAKLLRVLQEKEVERLGGRKTIALDVRVVATSNRNLPDAVANGEFREDLYYRLNVFPINCLALKDRPDDIIPIAKRMIERHAKTANIPVAKLTNRAKSHLTSYHWPGNVRELDNVIQRAIILHSHGSIKPEDLHFEHALEESKVMPQVDKNNSYESQLTNSSLGSDVKQHEYQIIKDALLQYHGSRKDVAESLGISPRTLRYKMAKMRELGIEVPA